MTVKISKISRFSSPYDVPGYMLRLMGQIWHRRLNAALAEIDLTEMQFVLLISLGWIAETTPAGVSQKELAYNCGASTALTSQVLRTLKKKNFVVVSNDDKDARARIVRLSKSGEKKLEEAIHVLERVDHEFWSDDPGASQNLFAALKKCIDVKVQNSEDPDREFGAMFMARSHG